MLILADDIAISVWDPIVSKQLKVEQILSLKTSQERPLLKPFATQYSGIMREIHASELKLSQLSALSEAQPFGSDDISRSLTTHKETLAMEIKSCSQVFENILNHTLGMNLQDDNKRSFTEDID